MGTFDNMVTTWLHRGYIKPMYRLYSYKVMGLGVPSRGPPKVSGVNLQEGQASWTICGKTFRFRAGMTLDVRL